MMLKWVKIRLKVIHQRHNFDVYKAVRVLNHVQDIKSLAEDLCVGSNCDAM
jgi:hypothetical protein